MKEVRDKCGIITVNRPDVLNAINRETMEELKDAFMDFRSDSGVGVIILTGAGEKSFIAGADITEMSSASATEAVASARRGQELTNVIESSPKPVIAVIERFYAGWRL